MRIAVCSDIHLEFGPISLENNDNADVLVLSGDICVAKDVGDRDTYNILGEHTKSNTVHQFFQECSARFPHVVYIMGNHEHYHGDYAHTHKTLKERLGYLKNLYILDKEIVRINDYTFIGGTLWTDMNKEDPITLHSMKRMMNDFRCVDNSTKEVSYKKMIPILDENGNIVKGEDGFGKYQTEFSTRPAMFSPEDAVEDHRKMIGYIKVIISHNPTHKYIVCGHHAPSKASTKPKYEKEHIMNGGYSSSLDEFILDHSQIKLWTHGHTHEEFDYMIGSTRIVCNPRGYINYEGRADDFVLKTFEI